MQWLHQEPGEGDRLVALLADAEAALANAVPCSVDLAQFLLIAKQLHVVQSFDEPLVCHVDGVVDLSVPGGGRCNPESLLPCTSARNAESRRESRPTGEPTATRRFAFRKSRCRTLLGTAFVGAHAQFA